MEKFKVGDWCFSEFELKQIKRMEGENVTGVSCGFFETGGNLTDRCFPLTMDNKRKSDAVMAVRKKFNTLPGNLNMPDIFNELVWRWVELCNTTDKDALKVLYDSLYEFERAIEDASRQVSSKYVGGLKVFR